MSASDSTVAACAAEAVASLVAAGQSPASARLDVAVLARHILHWEAAQWLTDQRLPAPALFRSRLGTLTARRAINEPVAYIIGEREFYGRSFLVSRQVLIPRPETEDLIDAALVALGTPSSFPGRVLDIGTGSGCLAVTIAREVPGTRVDATDVSEAALDVARQNAARHGAGDTVSFHNVSRHALAGGPFDVILSNPPYVPESDRASLSPDVRDYEPSLALFGGWDGLDVIRALLPDAARSLCPGGWLFMEIGQGQAGPVEALVRGAGLDWIGVRPDLAGIPRVVVAQLGS